MLPVAFTSSLGIYETDECHLHVNTYKHGRIVQGQRYLVVGIFLQRNHFVRLSLIRVGNSVFLNEFVFTFDLVGATFISDMLRGYNRFRTLRVLIKQ